MRRFIILSLIAAGTAAGGILGHILLHVRKPLRTLLLLAAAIPVGGVLGYVLLREGEPGSWLVFLAVCWLAGQGFYSASRRPAPENSQWGERKRSEKDSGPMKLAVVAVVVCVVSCGYFPIVNFHPDNPVTTSPLLIILMVFCACTVLKELGTLEAQVFPKRLVISIGMLNATLVLSGLLFRYLLEFGEASNTYNFTVMNILFHVTAFASVSTVTCALEKRNG